MRILKLTHTNRMIMPQLEQVFEKKGLFKHCMSSAQVQQIHASQPQIQNSASNAQVSMASPVQLIQGAAAYSQGAQTAPTMKGNTGI